MRHRTAAAALVLACAVAAGGGPGTARADDAKDFDVWLSMSYRGARMGWVHWVHRRELDDTGKLTARRVDHTEVYLLTDPAGETRRVTRTMESVLEPDWRLRSYTSVFESAFKRERETVNVIGDSARLKRVEWDLQGGEEKSEGREVENATLDYDGTGLRVSHPFQLGEQILGLDLQRDLTYVTFRRGREGLQASVGAVRYRVVGQDEAGNFRVAGRDGPRSFEMTLSPDGAPVSQAYLGTDTLLTAVASAAEATDLSKPAPTPDPSRGLGLRLKDGVFRDYLNGFSIEWPGLPWILEQQPFGPPIVMADPSRAMSLAVIAEQGIPPQVSLDDYARDREARQRAGFEAYEPGPVEAVELGGAPARSIRGKLRLTSGERTFRRLYFRAPPDRGFIVIAYAPADATAAQIAEIDAIVGGFRVMSADDTSPRIEGNAWRDPRAGYELRGPSAGWRLHRRAPTAPDEPPAPGPDIWLEKEDGAARLYVFGGRATALGISLDELAGEASAQATREFGSQVSDVTTETGELGERDVLRVRFRASKEDETKSFVVRRIVFIEDGQLLVLTAVIVDESKEAELLPTIEATAKTLKFWEP